MKRRWYGAAALVAAACAGSLFTASRIEAQYSSPVKVVNTTSGPAIASILDNQGRIAYQAVSTEDGCGNFHGCGFTFSTVPAGHRLVVQQISDFRVYSGTPSLVNVSLSLSPSGPPRAAFYPPPLSSFPYSQQVTAYFDASETPLVLVTASGTTFFSSPGSIKSS